MVSTIAAGIPASNNGQNAQNIARNGNAPASTGVNSAARSQITQQTSQTSSIRRVDPVQKPEKSNVASDPTGQGLTPEEQQTVRELQARDQEVRAHEQAHATVGGPYASAPRYDTVRGPDGRQYAVGGEVQIDASPENDPEDTIRKMEIVIRAALAPAEPSPQDRQVAQQARQQLLQARIALQEQQTQERENQGNDNSTGNIQSAIDNLRRADEAQRLGRDNPVGSNDDNISISDEAQGIVAALFNGT